MVHLSRPVLSVTLNLYAWLRYPHLLSRYWRTFRQFPDVAFPRSFNEKLLWRKVFDRDPRYGPMTDKLAARDIVRAVVPEVATPEIFWSGDTPEDLPPEILQQPCVLKTNRGSGWNMFNWTANHLTWSEVVSYFKSKSKRVYGHRLGEWTYGMFKQKFYAEELFVDPDGRVPDDFNFHIFAGRVLTITLIHDRFGDRAHASLNRDLSSTDSVWELYRVYDEVQAEAIHYKMIEIAERLAVGTDYIRVDLFCHNDKIYFREFTFFPGSGLSKRNMGEGELERNTVWDLSRASFLAGAETGWKQAYRKLLDADFATAMDELKLYRNTPA